MLRLHYHESMGKIEAHEKRFLMIDDNMVEKALKNLTIIKYQL